MKKYLLALLICAPLLLGAQINVPGPIGQTTSACTGTFTFNPPSTSWTPNCTGNVRIRAWGGGGSGGGWSCCQSGGGSGGFVQRTTLAVTNGVAITFIIGLGGASPGNATGLNGTSTTVDGCTANGGGGGGTVIAANGGPGGTASGCNTNTTGNAGANWISGGDGYAGGNAPGTGGGAGGAQGNPGGVGNAPGGGGAGGSTGSTSGKVGGAGQVIFEYI